KSRLPAWDRQLRGFPIAPGGAATRPFPVASRRGRLCVISRGAAKPQSICPAAKTSPRRTAFPPHLHRFTSTEVRSSPPSRRSAAPPPLHLTRSKVVPAVPAVRPPRRPPASCLPRPVASSSRLPPLRRRRKGPLVVWRSEFRQVALNPDPNVRARDVASRVLRGEHAPWLVATAVVVLTLAATAAMSRTVAERDRAR